MTGKLTEHIRRGRDDRGVVIVFVALLMVAMLVIVAIVIDLGRERANQRADQSTADLGALAAGYYLSGHGSGSSATSNPRAACQAAYTSASTNQPAFTASTAPCNVFPTDAKTCINEPVNSNDPTGTAPQDAVMSGGGYTLTVRYPIPSTELTDYSSSAQGTTQCQRMKVTFTLTDNTMFAGVIGHNSLTTTASAIVRASTSQKGQGVAALLLLERVGCATLQTSGGGSNGSGVVVESSGLTNPGVIQADSAGVVGANAPVTCTTNNNSNGYPIYGTALPAAGGGGPSITAESSGDGSPGIIGIFAFIVGGRTGAVYPGGLSVAPTAGDIASRIFADQKYNNTSSGGNSQITQLHAQAYAATTMNWGQAQAAGFTFRINGGNCNNYSGAPTDAKIFVDCTTFSPTAALFANATDVVFTGNIDLGSSGVMSMPFAQRVYVRGCGASCTGSNDFAIKTGSNGSLFINTGDIALPSSQTSGNTCGSRPGPGQGGAFTNKTYLATFGGPFLATGFARMCQTFVYIGENSATYLYQTQPATQSGTENYPPIARCAPELPCPKDNAATHSYISITGGNGVGVEWTAPNQLDHQPLSSELAYGIGSAFNPFEDLALWTETSSTQNVIKGQGANSTTGVYFIPNGSAIFTGQASQQQPLNAQFIVRALNISGQGNLFLKPNPADAVITPLPGNFALIR